jgi:hypothetical protein
MVAIALGKIETPSSDHICALHPSRRAPYCERFSSLAPFGRRPPQRVDRPSFRRPKTCTESDSGDINVVNDRAVNPEWTCAGLFDDPRRRTNRGAAPSAFTVLRLITNSVYADC